MCLQSIACFFSAESVVAGYALRHRAQQYSGQQKYAYAIAFPLPAGSTITHIFHCPPYRCLSSPFSICLPEDSCRSFPMFLQPIAVIHFTDVPVRFVAASYTLPQLRTAVCRHTRFLFIGFGSDVPPYHCFSLFLPTLCVSYFLVIYDDYQALNFLFRRFFFQPLPMYRLPINCFFLAKYFSGSLSAFGTAHGSFPSRRNCFTHFANSKAKIDQPIRKIAFSILGFSPHTKKHFLSAVHTAVFPTAFFRQFSKKTGPVPERSRR